MRFILSDSSLNSYGFRVLTKGIDYSDFLKNPVMFYKHDRDLLPIGKWIDIRVEGDQLTAEPEFDMSDEFAVKIKNKVDKGILNSASIGFDIVELSEDPKLLVPGQKRPTVSKSIINEASIADIPGNKRALKLHFSSGITLSGDMPDAHLNYVLPILNTQKNMSKVALALGLSADATEEQMVTALGAVTKKHQDDAVQALVILGKNKGFKKETIEKLAKADFMTTLSLIQDTADPEVQEETEEAANKDKGRLSDLIATAQKELAGGKKSKETDERASWTLSKWEKEDPSGLETMLSKDPAKYQKLFKDTHGYEPTLNEIKDLTNL